MAVTQVVAPRLHTAKRGVFDGDRGHADAGRDGEQVAGQRRNGESPTTRRERRTDRKPVRRPSNEDMTNLRTGLLRSKTPLHGGRGQPSEHAEGKGGTPSALPASGTGCVAPRRDQRRGDRAHDGRPDQAWDLAEDLPQRARRSGASSRRRSTGARSSACRSCRPSRCLHLPTTSSHMKSRSV